LPARPPRCGGSRSPAARSMSSAAATPCIG
jgi:hypothetical protein